MKKILAVLLTIVTLFALRETYFVFSASDYVSEAQRKQMIVIALTITIPLLICTLWLWSWATRKKTV